METDQITIGPGKWARVIDNIYIGNKDAVSDVSFLTKKRVGLIVDCAMATNNVDPRRYHNMNIAVVSQKMEDYDICADRRRSLAEVSSVKFIIDCYSDAITLANHIYNFQKNIGKSGRAVLVNCSMGVNRSALVIGVFLKIYYKLKPNQIFDALIKANETRDLPALTNSTFRKIIEVV